MKIIFNKTNIISSIFFILFILLCVIYYFGCNYFFVNFPYIYNYSNLHDHLIYLNNISNIDQGNILLSLNNDFGIAFIYKYIIFCFNFFGINDIELIAFIFNLLTVIIIFRNYLKVCDKLDLTGFTKFLFFLGLQILYFTQLINKDLLTLLFFTLILKWLLNKNYKFIILFSIFFFVVRIQLLIFGIITIYLSFGNFKRRFIYSYIFTSILGAIISVKSELISDESMGSGFSMFLIEFNRNFFYTGYLIFNPLRVLQFIMDIFMSFNIYTDGLIDVSKVLRIPLLIGILFLFKQFVYSINNFRVVNDSKVKQIFIILISFSLTWLMNPTINARYVMLIVPFILLFGRYVKINKKQII